MQRASNIFRFCALKATSLLSQTSPNVREEDFLIFKILAKYKITAFVL